MLALCFAKQLLETKNIGGALDITKALAFRSNSPNVDNYDLDNESLCDCVRKALFDKEHKPAGMLEEGLEHANLVQLMENCLGG